MACVYVFLYRCVCMYYMCASSTLDWFSIAPYMISKITLMCSIKSKDDGPPRGLVEALSLEKLLHSILEAPAAEYTKPDSQPYPVLHSLHCLPNVIHSEGRSWREGINM